MTSNDDRERKALAAAIKAEARGRGLSIGRLAEASGVPKSTLDTYVSEANPIDIPLSRFRAIAEALDMTPQELLSTGEVWEARLAANVPTAKPRAERRRSWHAELAEEFRRAYARQPHLSPTDIMPRRPHMVQRAIDGDPTMDEATLKLVARGLGLDPKIVADVKDAATDAPNKGASDAAVS